jgi:hypothetical protein
VDAGLEFLGEHLVDTPLALDARQPLKHGRHDRHAKMTLATRLRARMTVMQAGFIDDPQFDWRKSGLELCAYGFLNACHRVVVAKQSGDVKQEVFLSSLPSIPIL